MKGDFSRSTFDPKKHYTTVRVQQGRVQLDADWNEQMDILVYLLRGQAQDLLGPYGAPARAAGFAIAPPEPGDPPDDLRIAAGRYYVDGILVENDSDTSFNTQPYWPHAGLQEAMEGADRCVVYLDVWERHLSGSEAPSLLEPALGGLDTTTRTQTVWQVKLWPAPASDNDAQPTTNKDLLNAWSQWRDAQGRSKGAGGRGALRPRVTPAGYGLTNQLYRVEIHTGGDEATFKWSRNNGSVTFAVTNLQLNDKLLTVTLEGVSAETDLQVGDWWELADPSYELSAQPAPLFKICDAPNWDPGSAVVNLVPAIAPGEQERQQIEAIGQRLSQVEQVRTDGIRTVLRRWEHNEHAQENSAGRDGAIAVQPNQWLPLENGLEVRFEGTGNLRTGDHWLIPARSAAEGYALLWPVEPTQAAAAEDYEPAQPSQADAGTRGMPDFAALPARQVAHHLAPLAVLARSDTKWDVTDARTLFRPLAGFEAEETSAEQQLRASVGALRAELAHESAAALARVHSLRHELLRALETSSVEYRVADPAAGLTPGQVVALEPGTGCIEPATRDNAALVVGVTLGQAVSREGWDQVTDIYRVAQHGRQECLVVGRVEPGDLLVPSDVPGCAASAGVYIQPGTVIGKALQAHHPTDVKECATIAIMVTLL